MPDKPLTIATYAAGASLAAITLVYVFGPTFFIDGESSTASSGTRKRGVVGLLNPANDCFINSVLQALAGLGDLRVYLIREIHRRRLDGPEIYAVEAEEAAKEKGINAGKLAGLRAGIVTRALKDILDSLNERPIYKKTISAGAFVEVLEDAFKQRISRQQQDAQEFLQVVAERLSEEYHAGKKARQKSRKRAEKTEGSDEPSKTGSPEKNDNGDAVNGGVSSQETVIDAKKADPTSKENGDDESNPVADEDGFPLEGTLESQIECQTCHFKPKPSVSTFVTLTLNVPQQSSTTLNNCFDGLFKTEYIDDFKCDKCRLSHALDGLTAELAKTPSSPTLPSQIAKLKAALASDPENPPPDLTLPNIKDAPKRRIALHVRITSFPKIIAIHLSRSIFDERSSSRKNSAKVAFPERLPLGGLLDQKKYKLLGVVTHKGSHNSGHYESFRRQNLYPPYSTPHTDNATGAYRAATPTPSSSTASSPTVAPDDTDSSLAPMPITSLAPSSPSIRPRSSHSNSSLDRLRSHLSSTTVTTSPLPSSASLAGPAASSPSSDRDREISKDASASAKERDKDSFSLRSLARHRSTKKDSQSQGPTSHPRQRRVRPSAGSSRWWRISDDRVKECKTQEVVGMQKEVYLLFYELER